MKHVINSPEQVKVIGFEPPSITFRTDEEHTLVFNDPRALVEFWFHVKELLFSVLEGEDREVDVLVRRVNPDWVDDDFEGVPV